MRGREGKEGSTVGEMERGGGEGCCIFSDGKDRGCRSRQRDGGKSMRKVEIRRARGWPCR